MTIRHKGAVIAIWVTCGGLLVIVAALITYLCCRRARAHERKRYLMVSGTGASDDANEYYKDYTRLTGVDVCTTPPPGTYASPCVVHIQQIAGIDEAHLNSQATNAATTANDATPSGATASPLAAALASSSPDILVNIFYVDPATTTVVDLQSKLLGSDGHYSEAFLLYTAPLQFVAPGNYVIQAYSVYHGRQAVGPVHQFVFTITSPDGHSAAAAAASAAALPASANPFGVGAGSNFNNNVELNLRRSGIANATTAQSLAASPPSWQPQSQLAPGQSPWSPRSPHEGGPPLAGDALAEMPTSASSLQPGALLPPKITPDCGTVTTRTPITIAPNERSTTADQIRYSIDGSYPTVLYTGPFTLSLPPESVLPEQKLTVTIQALAIAPYASAVPSHRQDGGGGGTSGVARAVVRVRHAGYSYFDPQVPTPIMRLRAVDATLYFDESRNPPGTRTAYELLYVSDVRRRKARFSRRRCQLYNRKPIAIHEDVAMVYAWTVEEADWERQQQQEAAATAASSRGGRDRDSRSGLVQSGDDDDDVDVGGRAPGQRLRSVATVYDCASAAAEQAKPSRKRVEQLSRDPSLQLLPAPVVCVSCAEMEIEFEDTPANGIVAYTLNDTEPALYDVSPPACAVPVSSAAAASANRRQQWHERASQRSRTTRGRNGSSDDSDADSIKEILGDDGGLHTYRYDAGKSIRVTLLETEGVHVTARVFMPVYDNGECSTNGGGAGDGSGHGQLTGYRYGDVFHRGFFFSD